MGQHLGRCLTGRPPARYAEGGQDGAAGAGAAARVVEKVHGDAINWVAAGGAAGETLSAGEDKAVVAFDWTGGRKVVRRWAGHTRGVNKVVAAPALGAAFSCSRDLTIRQWRYDDGDAVQSLEGHELTVSGIAVRADCTRLASGSRDTSVRLWDVERGVELEQRKVSRNLVTCLRWVPDSELVLQSSEDLRLKVWDTRTMAVAQSFEGHVYIQTCCDVSADGALYLTSSNGFDGQGCEARIWDSRQGKQLHVLEGHTQSTGACCFVPSSDGNRLFVATGSADRSIRIWDASSGACLHVENLDNGAVQSLTPTPFGLVAATFEEQLFAFSVGEDGVLAAPKL